MNPKAEELKKRTAAFAKAIVELCDHVPTNTAGRRISGQLIDAATAVNSNYRAACRARSHREFVAKIGVVTEEADESLGWLQLLISTKLLSETQAAAALKEADELTAIFTASQLTAQSRLQRDNFSTTKPRKPPKPESQSPGS
jgi:four helix bundle protein